MDKEKMKLQFPLQLFHHPLDLVLRKRDGLDPIQQRVDGGRVVGAQIGGNERFFDFLSQLLFRFVW